MPGMRRLFKVLWPRVVGATTDSFRRMSGGSWSEANVAHPIAVESHETDNMKFGPAVHIRTSSDTSDFIPLRDMDHPQDREHRDWALPQSIARVYGNGGA